MFELLCWLASKILIAGEIPSVNCLSMPVVMLRTFAMYGSRREQKGGVRKVRKIYNHVATL